MGSEANDVTMKELHQLFSDMQMMVEQQGETLTNVEQHAENTVGDLKQGNTFLTKAIASARATRHVSQFLSRITAVVLIQAFI